MLQQYLSNAGQQPRAVRCDHFHHRALVDGVVGEGHFRGEGKVLQLSGSAAVDDVRVIFRVIQFLNQAHANPILAGRVNAQGFAFLVQNNVGTDGEGAFA